MSRDLPPFPSERDELFSAPGYPKPFEFNEAVAAVFDDMVSRSVPLYAETLRALGTIVTHLKGAHKGPGTLLDVGCSTGTTLLTLGRLLPPGWTLIGVDPSAAMLRQAERKCEALAGRHALRFIQARGQDCDFSGADGVILNYTLQFLPVRDRQPLLQGIGAGMNPGGFLFLSEKIRFPSSQEQELTTAFYESFKRSNGYSETEIARKKEALENVLVPMTEAEHLLMLRQAGFATIMQLCRWLNFASWLALKPGRTR